MSEKARVRRAQSEIKLALDRLQQEHNLTDVEMLQALTSWTARTLEYLPQVEQRGDADVTAQDEDGLTPGWLVRGCEPFEVDR